MVTSVSVATVSRCLSRMGPAKEYYQQLMLAMISSGISHEQSNFDRPIIVPSPRRGNQTCVVLQYSRDLAAISAVLQISSFFVLCVSLAKTSASGNAHPSRHTVTQPISAQAMACASMRHSASQCLRYDTHLFSTQTTKISKGYSVTLGQCCYRRGYGTPRLPVTGRQYKASMGKTSVGTQKSPSCPKRSQVRQMAYANALQSRTHPLQICT